MCVDVTTYEERENKQKKMKRLQEICVKNMDLVMNRSRELSKIITSTVFADTYKNNTLGGLEKWQDD